MPINVYITRVYTYIGASGTTATPKHLLHFTYRVPMRVENAAANEDDRRQQQINIGTRTLCI